MTFSMFNKHFRDYLRKEGFPEVFFHNSFALSNALSSSEYKPLVERYEKLIGDKLL